MTAGPSLSDLIRDELKGKNTALARYDAILWKIRSGYIAVLYGTLTFLGVGGHTEKLGGPLSFLLVAGFSLLGGLLDYSFVQSQLRVVEAMNELIDEAVRMAAGETPDFDRLRKLLHNAGMSDRSIPRAALRRAFVRPLVLYLLTPAIAAALLARSAFVR